MEILHYVMNCDSDYHHTKNCRKSTAQNWNYTRKSHTSMFERLVSPKQNSQLSELPTIRSPIIIHRRPNPQQKGKPRTTPLTPNYPSINRINEAGKTFYPHALLVPFLVMLTCPSLSIIREQNWGWGYNTLICLV